MSDGPLSPTCLCGGAEWHKLVSPVTAWCRRCGSVYVVYAGKWQVPLDRASEVMSQQPIPEEEPTRPEGVLPKKTRSSA